MISHIIPSSQIVETKYLHNSNLVSQPPPQKQGLKIHVNSGLGYNTNQGYNVSRLIFY
jgi:hypothetical protein